MDFQAKYVFYSILGLLALLQFLFSGMMATSPIENNETYSQTTQYDLAKRESQGFFTDITSKAWHIKKKIYQKVKEQQVRESQLDRLSRHPEHFDTNAYEPEFTCPHEIRIGHGDGGKWVCDPHRIIDPCLVYSIGVKGDIQFEAGIQSWVAGGKCEIHSFDLNDRTPRGKPVVDLVASVGGAFHHWGIMASEEKRPRGRSPWKTFKQSIQELGHTGRTIDILKVDCEGCEWESIHYWLKDMHELNVTARQVLFETHEPPPHPGAKQFFQALHDEGFFIFHKEANSLAGGKCFEYAWIRLDQSFQNQPVGGVA